MGGWLWVGGQELDEMVEDLDPADSFADDPAAGVQQRWMDAVEGDGQVAPFRPDAPLLPLNPDTGLGCPLIPILYGRRGGRRPGCPPSSRCSMLAP